MSQTPKLILGTAEFGPKAYGEGRTEPISLNEIRNIRNLAKKGGIKILEGAEDYNCDTELNDPDFELIYKVRHPYNLDRVLERTSRTKLMGLLYHHGYESRACHLLPDPRVSYSGASIYDFKQLLGSETMVEVPLNMENRTFEKLTAPCKIVRSVFGRGKLLDKYKVKDCLDYVKSLSNVHGVIVGVNSVKELDQVLEAWGLV